ncbi:interactor of HORMAD1 protein 1 [Saccopteryx bilineata]|uniref:interactor of HORMAD1 protein 1 n=1 Tax=Saccopteryx bilineata TaxID=59482 RepID=UPI00338E3B5C
MNFNVWNIKDMLSIPSGSGTTKSSNWTNNQTDYSSLSDSQFLFGSQFCPESSEILSAPLDVGVHLRDPKQLQKNSLDNEPSIFTKYQTKPQLFGDDTKDGGLFPLPLSAGKSKGLLEQFEEKKKTAKDKCDSETLYNIISHVRESIHNLQTSVEKSEEHLSSKSQSILNSLETVAKTLQETVQAQTDVVLGKTQDRGDLEQAVLEMQNRLAARQAEFVEMKSSLQHLEVLVAQQSKDFQQLYEQLGRLDVPRVLAELRTLISERWMLRQVRDSTAQTSPPQTQSPSLPLQDSSASEDLAVGSAQALLAARTLRTGSLPPGELGGGSEGAERAALQEATLPAATGGKRNRCVRDKAVQTNCKNQLLTKTSPEDLSTSIRGRQPPSRQDLVSQGASLRFFLRSNKFVTSIENTHPKHHTRDVFSCDPREQRLVAGQEGRTGEHGRKGRQPPRKGRGRRPLARKPEQTQGRTCALSSKCSQHPGSGSQRSTLEQQEPFAQPLHLGGPRKPTKLICPLLEGRRIPRTAGATQGGPLQLRGHSSQDDNPLSNSSKGEHQISWFSNLTFASSESSQCKEPGKNVLYDLAFDSSDDGF